MRKTIFAVGAVILIAGMVVPADARTRPKNRVVTEDYTMAQGMIVASGYAHWELGTEVHLFKSRRGENEVTFSIGDSSGQPVRGHVYMDIDGDDQMDTVKFCSETEEPIRIRQPQTIQVRVILGLCEDNTPSVVSTGTITASFSR